MDKTINTKKTILIKAGTTSGNIADNTGKVGFHAHEPDHVFRFGGCAWGVQFHPEFSADAMSGMIREQSGDLKAEGFVVEALPGDAKETPEAYALLEKFSEFVQNNKHPEWSE